MEGLRLDVLAFTMSSRYLRVFCKVNHKQWDHPSSCRLVLVRNVDGESLGSVTSFVTTRLLISKKTSHIPVATSIVMPLFNFFQALFVTLQDSGARNSAFQQFDSASKKRIESSNEPQSHAIAEDIAAMWEVLSELARSGTPPKCHADGCNWILRRDNSEALLRCSGCNKARYCSKECQKKYVYPPTHSDVRTDVIVLSETGNLDINARVVKARSDEL